MEVGREEGGEGEGEDEEEGGGKSDAKLLDPVIFLLQLRPEIINISQKGRRQR